MKYDLFATRIVMQPYLHGCSMLPSWRAKTEFPVLRVAWHSIYEAEISARDQFWYEPQRVCCFP
jgi:hypothetical protein